MQIIRLELDYFLKHEHLKLDLKEATNVLRGANEAGKCVKGDTLIHTQEGTVQIGSLAAGRPEGFTPLTGEVFSGGGAEALSQFYWEKDKPLFKVTTKHGYGLSGTANHPLLVYLPKTNDHQFRSISELRPGDFLCIDRRVQAFSEKNLKLTFEDYSEYNNGNTKPFACEGMTESLAAVCGYLLANGSGSGGTLQFSSNNMQLQEDFAFQLSRLGVSCTDIEKRRGKRVCHTNFKRFINYVFGVEKFPTARYKTVPASILRSTREVQRVFLRTLFDCDGHQHAKGFEWVTASRIVAETVKVMLLNFGVVTTTSPKRVAGYDHIYWRTQISGRDVQGLFDKVLGDSLKYTPPKKFYPSKNDTIPGLLRYIRGVLGPKTQKNGWMALATGAKTLNKIFSGTTGQPQDNLQVERLASVLKNLEGMPKDLDIEHLEQCLRNTQRLGYFYSEITSIEPDGVGSVYDVTVPGSHSFVANGIVSHNSSAVEGLGYLISGAGALAKSLEDTVNWGAKSKAQMKVSCTFLHAGETYSVVRGATGAEISKSGVVVCTGHKPVTQYLENLLGLPAGRAHHVMLANQNEIRGVLALGPTAASEFIEKLADFSEIDKLIKKAVAELPNGNTAALEENIIKAEAALAAIVVPEVPDHSVMLKSLKESQRDSLDKATAIRERHQNETAARASAEAQLGALQLKLTTARNQWGSLNKAAELLRASLEQEGDLLLRKAACEDLFQRHIVHKTAMEINEVNNLDQDYWDGDFASLQDQLEHSRGIAVGHSQNLIADKATQTALTKQKITSTICPTCKTILSNPAVVAEHNGKIDAELAALGKTIAATENQWRAAESEVADLEAIVGAQKNLLNKSKSWPEHLVSWNTETVPWKVSFVGRCPEPVDMDAAQRAFTEVNRKLSGIPPDGAQAVAVAEARAKDAEAALAALQQELAEIVIPEVTVDLGPVSTLEAMAEECSKEHARLLQETQDAAVARAGAEATRLSWHQVIDRDRGTLRETRANTEFIKALKEARLKVSEKLWAMVMDGVSNYFSRLRGVPSVVLRTADGFLVDGKAGRPSGSTLDILGLALRIVIAKVFANSGLLVVDEPSAGCDVQRTANMAAVLTSCGFEQILWVSHDDIAEVGAANLIEL